MNLYNLTPMLYLIFYFYYIIIIIGVLVIYLNNSEIKPQKRNLITAAFYLTNLVDLESFD